MTISTLGYLVLKVVLQVHRNQKRFSWKKLWPNLIFCLGTCWENNDKPSDSIADVLLETSCWLILYEISVLLLN